MPEFVQEILDKFNLKQTREELIGMTDGKILYLRDRVVKFNINNDLITKNLSTKLKYLKNDEIKDCLDRESNFEEKASHLCDIRLSDHLADKFASILAQRYAEKLLFEIFDPDIDFEVGEIHDLS